MIVKILFFFFDTVIFGAMFYKSEGKTIVKDKVKDVLGNDFYNDLLEIKDEIKLDKTIFGYFDRFFQVNKALAKHSFFLKFFKRSDIVRILIQKKVQGKNKVTRILSASIIEKSNGYEMIRQQLSRKEKIDLSLSILSMNLDDEKMIKNSCPLFFHRSNLPSL